MPLKLRELQEKRDLGKKAQQPHHSRWSLNLEAYAGNFWVIYEKSTQKVQVAPKTEHVRISANLTKPAVRHQVADLTNTRPSAIVYPPTQQERDVNAARAGGRVWEHYWRELKLAKVLRKVIRISSVFGDGFCQVGWDKNKGRSQEVVGVEGKPLLIDDQLQIGGPGAYPVPPNQADPRFLVAQRDFGEKLHTIRVSEGDVVVDAFTPFEFFPQAGKIELENMIEATRGQVKPIEEIEDRYNIKIKPESDVRPGVLDSLTTDVKEDFFGREEDIGDVATIYETYLLPGHPKMKNGGRYIWTDDKIIDEDLSYIYPHGELPYIKFSADEHPTYFFSATSIDDVREINQTYNKFWSQIVENAWRQGNPPMLKPRGSRVNWKGRVAEVVEFDPIGPESRPDFLQPPSLPHYIENSREGMKDLIRELAGDLQVTQESLPAQVSASSAIAQLNEAANRGLKVRLRDLEEGVEALGKQVLSLFQSFATEKRAIAIVGEDKQPWVEDLMGSDIHTDLRVEPGTGTPMTLAGKRQAGQDVLQIMAQLGIQPSKEQVRKLIELMEYGNTAPLFEDFDRESLLINHEIRWMIDNKLPYPGKAEIEDHEIHFKRHSDFEKSDYFRRLDKQTRQAMEDHRRWHQQEKERQLQEKQLEQQIQALDEQAQGIQSNANL